MSSGQLIALRRCRYSRCVYPPLGLVLTILVLLTSGCGSRIPEMITVDSLATAYAENITISGNSVRGLDERVIGKACSAAKGGVGVTFIPMCVAVDLQGNFYQVGATRVKNFQYCGEGNRELGTAPNCFRGFQRTQAHGRIITRRLLHPDLRASEHRTEIDPQGHFVSSLDIDGKARTYARLLAVTDDGNVVGGNIVGRPDSANDHGLFDWTRECTMSGKTLWERRSSGWATDATVAELFLTKRTTEQAVYGLKYVTVDSGGVNWEGWELDYKE